MVDGGPRDIYTDPLLLEVQVRWLDALLAALAGHPAVAAWELGHDPASTVRPARIADFTAWVALSPSACTSRTSAAGSPSARATWCGAAECAWHRWRSTSTRSAWRCARSVCRCQATLSTPAAACSWPSLPWRSPDRPHRSWSRWASHPARLPAAPSGRGRHRQRHRARRRRHTRAATSCCSGWSRQASPACIAAAWSDWGERLHEVPPATAGHGCHDRESLTALGFPSVSRRRGRRWSRLQRSVAARSPYPDSIDVESYYANLPDSLLDLHASWQGDRSDGPAILD